MGKLQDKMTQGDQSRLEDIARKEPTVPLRNVLIVGLGNVGNEISNLLDVEGYIHVGKTDSENLGLRLNHSFHDVVIAEQHQLLANGGQLIKNVKDNSPQTEIISIGNYDDNVAATLRDKGIKYIEEDPLKHQRFLAQVGNAINNVNSVRDGKTGLYTSSVFEAKLNDLIRSYSIASSGDGILRRVYDTQPKKYLGVIYLDIDNFKLFNDDYEGGHQQGDAVIAAVADAIKGFVRRSDLAGRIGGDEYAVAFEAHSEDEVKGYAKRIGEMVKSIRLTGKRKDTNKKERLKISSSVGYVAVSIDKIKQDAKGLLGLADGEMYKQKPHK